MISTQLPIVESKARKHQIVRSLRNPNKLSCSVRHNQTNVERSMPNTESSIQHFRVGRLLAKAFGVGRSTFAPLSGTTARQVSACHAEAFGVGGLNVGRFHPK